MRFLVSEREEDVKEEGGKRNISPQGETSSGKVWKVALPSPDFDAESVVYRCCSREAGARRGSGGAEDHYRVGCGQRHQSGPGWQKPSGGADEKASEKVEAVKRS